MLHVEEYLKDGYTLSDLHDEFGIEYTYHPTEPLIILNYHQINSASRKFHPIVRECRGLVLEDGSFKSVAKAFTRFYNFGEDGNEYFGWNSFDTIEKLDGSIIIVYYYYGWRINTRRSFGYGLIEDSGKTWEELFHKYVDVSKLDRVKTYVFELTSPYNTVVRYYSEVKFKLLGVFRKNLQENWIDFPEDVLDYIAEEIGVERPYRFGLKSLEEIKDFIHHKEIDDPTFEGVVVRDKANRRLKIKSRSYKEYHALKNNGHLFRSKYLIPLLAKGEAAELLAIFPDKADTINACNHTLQKALAELKNFHRAVESIPDQKGYALAVKSHPLSSLLFKTRSTGKPLDELWVEAGDLLARKLFNEGE